ncbi:cell division protein FtsZ [Synergistaceae bacterium OttesenSCG-928-D05]|nr:cell division protein FtsZ [Synergistaceae bacterium OttesenSCG-928-D05]
MGILAENLHLPEPEEHAKPSEHNPPFAIDKPERARREVIRVVAVGGGGGNALNHIISKGLEGVGLLAVNTDARSLDMSLCKDKIILGENVTKGLGAGAMPEVGERAARESLPEIREFLRGSDMVYFTAGMGGGTGTGALPVIAAAAKEMGILTVAVVTKPFFFEGARRKRYAEEGIAKLRDNVDALIVVPNDRLLDVSNRETPLNESFSMADEVLRQAVLGVTNLVTKPGMVNVDFADLKAVMKQAGPAVMGIGSASGENRIAKALQQALESPLMECSMQGAKGVLMNITCGEDLGILEISEAAAHIENIISDDAVFVWGCAEDPDLEGSIEIVVVATGFEEETGHAPLPPRPRADANPWRKPPTESLFPRHTPQVEFDVQEIRDPGETVQEMPPVEPERPRLISEMLTESGPSWLGEKSDDAKAIIESKTKTDQYDSPTFLREARALRKPQ